MKPKRFDFDLANSDDNGIFTVKAVSGAGALVLDGALISGGVFTSADGMARRIAQITAGNDSGITFTYVGTDSDGAALTEIVTGGSGTPSTETTTGYFLTITSITASGAAASDVTIGTVDEALSPTIPLDYASDLGCSINIDITGTINFTVRETFDNIQRSLNVQSATALAAKTADTQSLSTLGATAIQFVVNSFTDTAETQMYIVQPLR